MSLPSDPKPADVSEEIVESKDDDVGEIGEAHPETQEVVIETPKED